MFFSFENFTFPIVLFYVNVQNFIKMIYKKFTFQKTPSTHHPQLHVKSGQIIRIYYINFKPCPLSMPIYAKQLELYS